MSTMPPPPPDSQDAVTPEKPRKKRDNWNTFVAGLFALVLVGSVGYGFYAVTSEPSRAYPNRTSPSAQADAPTEADVEAMTFAIFQALEADNDRLLDATIQDIKDKTGCLAVAGGRVIVDPADQAEVALEASQRAQFEDSLEAEGLVVGHVEAETPEGLLHQVIGFECK